MAEEKPPEDGKKRKWYERTRNWFVTFLKWASFERGIKGVTGQRPGYRLYPGQDLLDAQPVLRIKEKHLLGLLRSRSSSTVDIEFRWENKEPEGVQGSGGIEKIRQKMESLYANSMIYLDAETAGWEYTIYRNGIQGKEYDKGYILIKGKKYEYPVPPSAKIRYHIPGLKREWIVTVSPFGFTRIGEYIQMYGEVIEQICSEVTTSALSKATSETEKNAIQERIRYIKSYFTGIIANLLLAYCGSEKEGGSQLFKDVIPIEINYYAFIKKALESSSKIAGTYVEADSIRLRKPVARSNFIYYSTFKVIQPILYGTKDESAVIKDRLDDPKYRWIVKKNELGTGLDEYGYPLEVDYDGHVLKDKYDEKGRLSSDKGRQVPQQFIKNTDYLDAINYETSFFDEYRDDLRDGRYHPNTTTIMDYIQANNKSIWNLWSSRNENEIKTKVEADGKITGQTEVEIELRGQYAGHKYKYKVAPTDKNPAFDFRFIEESGYTEGSDKEPRWRNVGRKHYYDVPDDSFAVMSHNPDAHISSRGVSMYIIEKVTREMEKFSETISILDEIGKYSIAGFDYGARPWDIWGKSLDQTIYEWRSKMARINAPIEGTPQEEYVKEFSLKGH